MADIPSPVETEAADKPALTELLGQIVNDTRNFARDEIAFMQAQAGERAHFALPGVIGLGVAAALALGSVIALLVGLTIWLARLINVGLATLIVVGVAVLVAALLGKWALGRLGSALKPRDER